MSYLTDEETEEQRAWAHPAQRDRGRIYPQAICLASMQLVGAPCSLKATADSIYDAFFKWGLDTTYQIPPR